MSTSSKKGGKSNAKSSKSKSNKSNRSSKQLSKDQKSQVEKIVKKNEETKIAPFEVFNQNLIVSSGLNAASGLGLTTTGLGGFPATIIPPIIQGLNNSDRIGNKISPQKFVVKYMIRAQDTTGNTAGTNPFRGKPFLVRMILYNQRYAIDDANNNNIIDKGATNGNIGSSPNDWLEPYNREDFKIYYSKTFKMVALSDTGTTPPTVENVPNGFKYLVAGRIYLKTPKALKYGSYSTSLPSNFAPKLAFCVCNADGSVVGASQYRAMVNVETQLYYTDA